MKAKEWLARSREGRDSIESFSNSWIAFNGLYSSSRHEPERDKISRCIDENVNDDVAHSLMQKYEEEIAYLLSRPVINLRRKERDTQEHVELFNRSDCFVEKLKSIFMIIYQVRCNLIHGDKSPTRERDLELCANSVGLVCDVVKACI